MSQNLRVAMWVPTTTPPHASGDSVQTNSLPDAVKRIQTLFTAGGGAGGGIPEAPIDNKQYARKNATWAEVVATGAGGGITDAPSDGNLYVRLNATWAILDGGTF